MSRAARSPVIIPTGVNVTLVGQLIKAKGSKGEKELLVHDVVELTEEDNAIRFSPKALDLENVEALVGTMKSLFKNLVIGVSEGFEKKLILKGVGYKAQMKGSTLVLNVGFSHQIKYAVPKEINITVPTQTEIVIKGIDKQLVGQVAANIRAFRPPEPYKGKGIRYVDEIVILKEGKKK